MTTNGLLRFSRSVRQLDGVALAIALTLLVLLLLVPAQMVASLHFTLDGLWRVAPFLLLSIAIAAYAQASGADNLIAKAFQGRIGVMVPIAAMFGAFSPFCSCGVIPLIAALLSMGVPVAAVMAFWLASPLMDPSMFVLTVGTLGLKFALFKTVATVAIGLLGGFGTLALMRFGPLVPAFAHVYQATSKRHFAQRLRRLLAWVNTRTLPKAIDGRLRRLKGKSRFFQRAFDFPDAYRTSNQVDRPMNYLDRTLYAMQDRPLQE
jgi:uncharacterized membrane protein YraQ (UPF0718 family)